MDMDLAFQNRDVLRALRAQGLKANVTRLAEATGRDVSNLSKTLTRLEKEGFVTRSPHLQLTPAAEPVLRAADAADGQPGEGGLTGFVGLMHAQISRDDLNPRKDFDSAEEEDDPGIAELASDILQNGLMQNLVVRPDHRESTVPAIGPDGAPLPMFRLVAGERRWRAIGTLIHDGDWPADWLIPCQFIDTDDKGHRLRALAENLQRRRLNPIEEAKAFHELKELDGLSTQEIADELSITQRQVQMRLQLLDLPAADQARMSLPKDDSRHLSVRDARAKLQKPKLPDLPALTPAQKLILVEARHKLANDKEGYYRTEVGYQAQEQGGEAYTWLKEGGFLLVYGPSHDTGRFSLQLYHGGTNWLDRTFGYIAWDDPDAVAPILMQVRAEAADEKAAKKAAKDGRYLTPWLNGPFEVGPEGQAVLDKRAADEAERQQKAAESKAAEEAERARGEAALATVMDIRRELAGLKIAPVDERIALVCEAAGAPLPYSINEAGDIVDANGAPLRALVGAPLEARRWLLVMGINAAAGLATPEKAPDPAIRDGDLSRVDFLNEIATALAEGDEGMDVITATAKSAGVLNGFLADHGIAYGDSNCAWNAEAAYEIANAWLESRDMAENDVAMASGDEAEISPETETQPEPAEA